MMNITELLQTISLGGLLGVLGQGIRALGGLKKLSESTAVTGVNSFDTRRLTISLFLGFAAGAIGVITISDDNWKLPSSVKDSISKESVLTLIGIGYSGVDFLESVLTKFVPKPVAPTPTGGVGPAAALPGAPAPPAPQVFIQVPQLPYSSK